MTENKLRLLLAEDSEDDAALLLHYLKKDHWEIEHFLRIDTPEDLTTALENNSWDLVITDHNMPSFDSQDVIKLVHAHNADLPVIIVSGSIGEETAVMMMKSGAADYIMKSNLIRLGAAIKREQEEAKSRYARRQAETQLQYMAYHDPLTDLINRRELELALADAIEHAKHYGKTHSFMYLDLDQFKIVNDTCGHMAGDELLRQISALLKKKIRDADQVARLGGDEFGIILNNCDLTVAESIANNLREAIEAYRFVWGKHPFSIGVSIGLVNITPESRDVHEVLSNADMACFAAKSRGRNRVYIYTADDKELASRRDEMQWISRINDALSDNRFVLYRQAITPLQDDSQHHFEVLLRMQGIDGEIIAPGAFIPAAERYDLMQRLDRWVVNHIFKYLANSSSQPKNNQLYFINLSGISLNDSDFFTYIKDCFAKYQVSPQNICFEVTETAAISNLNTSISFIQEIKELGCRFALDDFGTGLSSFSYLRSLPVDFLKIDGSFIKQLEEDEMNRAIVESINQIGHVAKLKTIAEFVENDAIQYLVESIGIDFAQGYGIHRPEPLENKEPVIRLKRQKNYVGTD